MLLHLALLALSSLAHGSSPSQAVADATCTPTAGGSSIIDDVPAIESAIAACPSGTIVLPAGTTYYLNSAMTNFSACTGCTIQLDGTLQASDDTSYWSGVEAMIKVGNVDGITFTSTGDGVFDGNGQASWDLYASDNSYSRPTMLVFSACNDVTVRNIYFRDAPNAFHHIAGDSTNLLYENLVLYAVSSSDAVAQNTDGFDVGTSTYVTIRDVHITNYDDCVVLKPGANYTEVYNVTCVGGHGMSLGSLASTPGVTDTVSNGFYSGITMVNNTKAAGIKFFPGGSEHGSAVVSNVTWENVVVENCAYAFQVQTCYEEDADYCAENPSTALIEDVVVRNMSGYTSDHYAPVAMNIDCPAAGSCDIAMVDVDVVSTGGSTEFLCANTESGIGIECTDGASG
ncbi:hypothetical protein BDW74DRAFT_178916 [Aspergillus multicolor]|uniref:uncharacterized protein n=1 Tax=Aspergillus multicolor TaxID=41759 RepID=UPI003CCDFD05